MCLVLSVLLFALSVNFYLNGFLLQAGLIGVMAVAFMILMIRNIGCRKNACGLDKKSRDEDTE